MKENETPYDKHWEYRDDFIDVGPRFFVRTGQMLRLLSSEPRGELLDVGCGDGAFIAKCLKQGWSVVGMDLSQAAIDRCQGRFNKDQPLRLFCSDITAIAEEGPFDAVTAGEVLEHIEDDEDFIRRVFALLKPGGAFVLTVPIDTSLWSGADSAAGHFRRYTVQEVSEKLKQAGFEVEKRIVWGWPITRALHFRIRDVQNRRMGEEREIDRSNDRLLQLKPLLRWAKYVFLIDNLFNWTRLGVGVVVKARRPA